MEIFANTMITIVAIIMNIFFVVLVHEIGHYIVARRIMKEPNVKIVMGFFGRPIINTKRLRINSWFFAGGYVGNYCEEGEAKKSHMIMLFASGAVFTILLGIPVALYLSGGQISLGDIINFQGIFSFSPLRDDLFSVPTQMQGFVAPWLSLSTPLDVFNMFVVFTRNVISILVFVAVVPYFYPLKLSGKWHWNPSDAMWVLKYIFNKVTEKDMANAQAAINEKTEKKQ